MLKKGLALSLLVDCVDHQTGLLTRENSDRKYIIDNIKEVFNAMLDKGDVDISDWSTLEQYIKNTRFERSKDVLDQTKNIYKKNILSNIMKFKRIHTGNTIESDISTENLKIIIKKDGVEKRYAELMLLIKCKSDLDKRISELMNDTPEMIEDLTDLLNKYGKLFPISYLTSVNRVVRIDDGTHLS